MAASPETDPVRLHATLAEVAGPLTLAPSEPPDAPELDVLPSFEVPLDRPIVTTRELAVRARTAGAEVLHATGAAGGTTGLVLRALAAGKRRVVAVTPDLDA